MQVEEQDNCTFDRVEIYDGHNANSSLIGIFCGYELPPNILSTGTKLSVKFVPDDEVQKTGFAAFFNREGIYIWFMIP